MKEDLLYYAWRLRKFNLEDLRTASGERVDIIQTGELNHDAGPDFLNARVKIGATDWSGNVEMHLRSSDWLRHGHDHDEAYNNVILHVVWENDVPIKRPTGEVIPCLELHRRIPPGVRSQYLRLLHNEKSIPCEGLLDNVPDFTWQIWLGRLSVERLENKIRAITSEMALANNNREEVFYRFVARNFGVKVNTQPFERLARSIPLTVLGKHRGSLFQIEALLFGQAGLLVGEFQDDYPRQLQREYRFLQSKYKLQPIHFSEWKYLRLRPANFPTIRIAQFAALAHRSQRLFSKVLWAKDFDEILDLFNTGVSDYWKTHYVFDKESKFRNKHLGDSAIRLLTINTVIPFLFHYGKEKSDPAFVDKALDLLQNLKAENNKVMKMWAEMGIEPRNAAQSQALLQLNDNYCQGKRCLECMVGNKIVGRR